MIAGNELRGMRPSIDTVFEPHAKERGSSAAGSASNVRGFLKADGDCGLRSGEQISSLAGLSPRLTRDERGQSALPKTMPRSLPAPPTPPPIAALPPIAAFLPI